MSKKESIDSLLQGDNKLVWQQSLMHKLGRLPQGIEQVTRNNCINFIAKIDVLLNKKVIYTNMVCDYR